MLEKKKKTAKIAVYGDVVEAEETRESIEPPVPKPEPQPVIEDKPNDPAVQ